MSEHPSIQQCDKGQNFEIWQVHNCFEKGYNSKFGMLWHLFPTQFDKGQIPLDIFVKKNPLGGFTNIPGRDFHKDPS